jgi:hypothetical protein
MTACGRGRRPRLQLQPAFAEGDDGQAKSKRRDHTLRLRGVAKDFGDFLKHVPSSVRIQLMKNRNTIFTAILFTLALLCAAVAPKAFGVVPPPDGGYPGFNTAKGQNALLNLTSGTANTGVGWFSLSSVTAGSFNTATGAGALLFNTAAQNTAFGAAALLFNTTGFGNTAAGSAALLNNTEGFGNTAIGISALFSNTIGADNTASGTFALLNNIEGTSNTATGRDALFANTTGNDNTATGRSALGSNTSGNDNTATGMSALASNTTGFNNTATGRFALGLNADGAHNTAVGHSALLTNSSGTFNTAIGAGALFTNTGSNNVALGFGAGADATDGNNNVYIGTQVRGVAGENHRIRIGDPAVHAATFIAGIRGQTVPSGLPVMVEIDGHLGTTTSSKRFKEEIKPMDKASEALLALKPVTFRYKKEIDPQGIPQFGLVAEEVEKVNPDLVVRDKEGKAYSVRYDQVNAMLLNEFLKEQRKNEEQQATITELKRDFQMVSAQQQNEIQILSAQFKEQAAQIQKVSAQIQPNGPAAQLIALRAP